MAISQLPASIRRLLEQQQAGFYERPNLTSNAGNVMSTLQEAAARRFGQSGEFDPEYDAGIRGLMSQIPDLESAYQLAQQRMDEDFTLNAEELDRDKTMQDSRHINTMANNGMGYSGANLVGQGRIAENFQRGVQGLVRGRNRGIEDLTGAQNAAYRQITSRSGELQGSAASRASARDQEQAWQMEQIRMQQEQARAQQDYAQRNLQMQEQIRAQNEAIQRRMEDQLRSLSQPRIAPTGSYRPAPRPSTPMRGAPTSVDRVNTPVYHVSTPGLATGQIRRRR